MVSIYNCDKKEERKDSTKENLNRFFYVLTIFLSNKHSITTKGGVNKMFSEKDKIENKHIKKLVNKLIKVNKFLKTFYT